MSPERKAEAMRILNELREKDKNQKNFVPTSSANEITPTRSTAKVLYLPNAVVPDKQKPRRGRPPKVTEAKVEEPKSKKYLMLVNASDVESLENAMQRIKERLRELQAQPRP